MQSDGISESHRQTAFSAVVAQPSAESKARDDGVQSKIAIDALIMKGGGVKGLAFAGAMRELERFFEFQCFVGTSAGAIAATLFASGASGAALEATLRDQRFTDFLDGNIWLLPFTFWTTRGLHPGHTFVDWLRGELHSRIDRLADIEMQHLPKRAVVYASTRRAGEVTFDKIGEHKDTAVHTAVRCSMSIPYLFQPQMFNNRRVYDGGLLNNYPIQIFLQQEAQRDPTAARLNFIGLYLGSVKPDSLKPSSVWDDLLHINIDRNDAKLIDQYRDRTIMIDTDPIGTVDFDLTDQQKEFLVLQGRTAALRFIDKRKLLSASEVQQIEVLEAQAAQLRDAIEAEKHGRRGLGRRMAAVAALIGVLLVLGFKFVPPLPTPRACQIATSIDMLTPNESATPLFLDVSAGDGMVRYPIGNGNTVELRIQPQDIQRYSITLKWSDDSSSYFEPFASCGSVNGRKSKDGRSSLRLAPRR
ncbi:putative acylesterase/phospholipase RssA [Bradyrhizobium sp. JR4.1]|uniref:patatin-like phospholipase family protein n=1 Tax=unclassified Bradyrhizobium TaxID=2631580 RepID=UPI00048A3EA7|nr:patatin-like phospholipase family protein [Bradyrhizobium sp. WSM1417]